MSKLTKKQKEALAKFDSKKQYKLIEACGIVKEINYAGFDASIELAVRLGVDPRKANQMVRGVVTLPNGTGKVTRVLVLCTPDKENEAKEAGADYVGLDDYIEKIKGGWTDVDVIICTPSVMGKVGPIGRILGPRGLMPNPKTGIIHSAIGKVSFSAEQINENAVELINTIVKLKPQALKGTYIKGISLSSTMSPGIDIDPKSIGATE